MNHNVQGPPKLPTLRMTAEGRCVIEDEVPLDLASNNRFSVSYASGGRSNPLPTVQAIQGEWVEAGEAAPVTTSPISTRSELPPTGSKDSFFQLPQFSRSASMPSPSQLTQLQHPHKVGRTDSYASSSSSSNESPSVREISYELADSIQMVVQTLLQVSPPQVLDITKEQFSACSLSVPTSSMSAMFTVMKNINYLSANMSSYFEEPPPIPTSARAAEKQPMQNNDENNMEFDIGEVLQCVGDSLSGTAAQVGVDMVIYHGDVSLKHVNVVGDEAGLSYAISHVIRQILNVAERGDTVELGLLLALPAGPSEGESSSSLEDSPLQCTIRIGHRFAFPERLPNDPYGPEPQQVRQQPNFSALLLRRILRQTSGTLIGDLPPPESYASGRAVELSFPLRRPRSSLTTPFDEPAISEDLQYHHDPTLRQLVLFAETLKGKKATLYASPEACFAQHLTSYLTAWGMEVTHVSPDGNVDGTAAPDASPQPMEGVEGPPAAPEAAKPGEPEPVFVFIDDDVEVLRERLLAQRSEHNVIATAQVMRKRPALSSLHRPKSTVNVLTALPPGQTVPPKTSVVIMHFTSLSNYKHLKDMVQTIMAGYFAATIPLPEIMILPKPAGPRRLLTALHMAATKPSIDLPFIPIATSPMSPGLTNGSFFSSYNAKQEPPPSKVVSTPSQPVSPNASLRPTGSRTNSDRSLKSQAQSETNSVPPITPSPLSLPENVEYFAAAAQKLGSTPSSGMVVQSPDGQPAGIYFRPKTRGSRAGSGSGDKDIRNQLTVPTSRRTTMTRPPSTGEGSTTSFSALYTASSAHPSPPINKTGRLQTNSEAVETPTTPSPRSPLAAEKDRIAAATLAMHASGSPSLTAKKDKAPSPILSPKPSDVSSPVSPSSPPRSEGPASLRRRHLRKISQSDKDSAGPSGMKKPKAGANDIIPPISVLIVDDNPINQTILSTFMKRKKIKYDIANNGAEAVTKWKSGGFHLILMDIQMPVMDGIQATKEIRKLEKANALAGFPPLTPTGGEGQSTPSESTSTSGSRAMPSPYRSSVIIVALTASSLQSDRDAALAAGCNDFLTKPVSLLWLNNKIIEWGSIKALQVWADIRPDVSRMHAGQVLQAKAVADRLQMPSHKKTPSPPPRRSSSLNKEEGAAALALASPAGSIRTIGNRIGSPAQQVHILAAITAPTMSSRSSSTKSEDNSPDSMSSSGGLPPVRKDSLESSSNLAPNEPTNAEQRRVPVTTTTSVESAGEQTSPEDVTMDSPSEDIMSSPPIGDNLEQAAGQDTAMASPADRPGELDSGHAESSMASADPADDDMTDRPDSPTPAPTVVDQPTPTVPTPPNEMDPDR